MLDACRKQQSQLSRQFNEGTLAHAILIQGVEGSGTNQLAQWLIDLLICQSPQISPTAIEADLGIKNACGQCKSCLLRKSGSYPDNLLLTSENKSLGVDDIRRGNDFLDKTAHLGNLKTILIPQAPSMTIAAANALLKTLEEPHSNNYIVLVTEELDALLPTIISRCAIYTIRPSIGDALIAQLNQTELTDSEINSQHIINNDSLSDNSFVNISQLPELSDEPTLKAFKDFEQSFLAFLTKENEEGSLLIKVADSHHSFRWLEKITANLIRQYYLNNDENKTSDFNPNKTSIAQLNQIYQAIISSNKLVKSYVQANRQFVGQQLIMTINDIVRPIQ